MPDSSSPSSTSSGKSSLFRARALDAIDSREGLDELMTIVPERSLYALTAIVVLLVALLLWGIFGRVPIVERGAGVVASSGGTSIVSAPADGTLISGPLPIGSVVTSGRVIARVRTGALEDVPLRAPLDGTIVDVRVRGNVAVKRGDPIVTIEPSGAVLRIVGFVDYRAQPQVVPGMAARVTPIDDSGVAPAALRGRVDAAAPEPATAARVATVIANGSLAATLGGTVREVSITIDGDAGKITPGSPFSIVLVTGEVSPLAFLFPLDH
jgi:hypothetical protein